MNDRIPTQAAQEPRRHAAGFPREVVLVNVADERDNVRENLDFPPIPGMYIDVPWSEVLHYVDYIQLERSTGVLMLGMLPMEDWR